MDVTVGQLEAASKLYGEVEKRGPERFNERLGAFLQTMRAAFPDVKAFRLYAKLAKETAKVHPAAALNSFFAAVAPHAALLDAQDSRLFALLKDDVVHQADLGELWTRPLTDAAREAVWAGLAELWALARDARAVAAQPELALDLVKFLPLIASQFADLATSRTPPSPDQIADRAATCLAQIAAQVGAREVAPEAVDQLKSAIQTMASSVDFSKLESLLAGAFAGAAGGAAAQQLAARGPAHAPPAKKKRER